MLKLGTPKSDSDSWLTPPEVYAPVERVFGRPGLDPCWHATSPVNPHVAFNNADGTDGLFEPWPEDGWVWLNPPYSDPAPWLEKLAAHLYGGIALLKADPSTKWWQKSVWGHARHVGWFKKRVRFLLPDGTRRASATFPSALVLFGFYMTPGTRRLLAENGLDLHWTAT